MMAGEDDIYRAYVRTLPCCAPHDTAGCSGRSDPHHAGRRGLGQKAHDHTAIPLCRKHHNDFENAAGVFKTWKQDQRREWIAARIAETRASFGRELPEWA